MRNGGSRLLQVILARSIDVVQRLTPIPQHPPPKAVQVEIRGIDDRSLEHGAENIPVAELRGHSAGLDVLGADVVFIPHRDRRSFHERSRIRCADVTVWIIVELDPEEVCLYHGADGIRSVGVNAVWRHGEMVGFTGVLGEQPARSRRDGDVPGLLFGLVIEIEAVQHDRSEPADGASVVARSVRAEQVPEDGGEQPVLRVGGEGAVCYGVSQAQKDMLTHGLAGLLLWHDEGAVLEVGSR